MNTDKLKTNRPAFFEKGYPKEYIKRNFDNKLEPSDDYLIDLSRLFLGISGAINPYHQALTFANYLIRNGVNLLPSVIMFYVKKFRTLPEAIQDYVIQNTPEENNYFRKDVCSDKVAFLARASEYHTNSSLVPAKGDNQPVGLGVSERIANKITPANLRNTVELVMLTNEVTKRSQPTSETVDEYVNKTTNKAHNKWKNIGPAIRPGKIAERAKPKIEARAYEKFKDLFRVFHEYQFKHRPYDIQQREDSELEHIIDKNLDTHSSGAATIRTAFGGMIEGFVQRNKSDSAVMAPTREQSADLTRTRQGTGPIGGTAGDATNKLNSTAGQAPVESFDSERHK